MRQGWNLQNSCSLRLFSDYTGDALGGFQFSLSVTSAIATISPGNSVLSQIFSPKLHGANASQFSYLELLTITPTAGNVSDSIETYVKTLRTISVSHSSGKESRVCMHREESLRDTTVPAVESKSLGHRINEGEMRYKLWMGRSIFTTHRLFLW